jgi:hypothetical protein
MAKGAGVFLGTVFNINSMKPKSVRARINELEISQAVEFPLERYDYIVSCRTRLQTTTGKRFSSRTDKTRGVVVIFRKS